MGVDRVQSCQNVLQLLFWWTCLTVLQTVRLSRAVEMMFLTVWRRESPDKEVGHSQIMVFPHRRNCTSIRIRTLAIIWMIISLSINLYKTKNRGMLGMCGVYLGEHASLEVSFHQLHHQPPLNNKCKVRLHLQNIDTDLGPLEWFSPYLVIVSCHILLKLITIRWPIA